MADNPRIDDLRRRLLRDPASIAFAQLAEEYRRAGRPGDAIRVCRSGLDRHPGYLSARVTLGRALLETGDLDAAHIEFQTVVASAPENLAAIRGLAEIYRRRGELPEGATAAGEPPPPAPPGRGRAEQTIAALEQFLAAIHVSRAFVRA
jgi:Flp pilus assembly protein TadD